MSPAHLPDEPHLPDEKAFDDPEAPVVHRVRLHGLDSAVDLEVLEGEQGPEADEALVARLHHCWARCLAPTPGHARPYRRGTLLIDDADSYVPGAPVRVRLSAGTGGPPRTTGLVPVVRGDEPHALQQVTQQVTRALILSRRGELLMLHASGITDPATGRSMVFVAPGGTGKTTLARALGRRWGYLSDETIAMDADGRIWPYPKPLSIRGEQAYKVETSPDDLGLQPADTPAHLHRLVLLRRQAGVADPQVEDLSVVDAIQALAPESSSLGALHRGLHVLADVLEATGGAQRWTYGEHAGLVPLVVQRLGTP